MEPGRAYDSPIDDRFHFVQFEFTHGLGPHAGRYVVAHDAAVDEHGAAIRTGWQTTTGVTMAPATADVLVIGVRGVAPARPKLRRKIKDVSDGGEPADVPLLLATFVRGTEPVSSSGAALEMLDAWSRSDEAQEQWVDDGLAVVNRAIRAYRGSAHDPYVTEVTRRDARKVRIGYGTTDQVADGRWERAFELPPPRGLKANRTERLAPSEITARVLSGRGGMLETEDVALRALLDLDHGRMRAAALQARAAVVLLGWELGERVDELAGRGELERLTGLAESVLADLRAGEPGRDPGTRNGDRPAAGPTAERIERVIAGIDLIVERWRYPAG